MRTTGLEADSPQHPLLLGVTMRRQKRYAESVKTRRQDVRVDQLRQPA